jgi:hypothetical protein
LKDEINLSYDDKKFICKIIKADTEMLRNLNIMDYSLLLGIEQKKEDLAESNRADRRKSRLVQNLGERRATYN